MSDEVDKIFGKNGKNKLKSLVKNVDVYSQYVIKDLLLKYITNKLLLL